MDMSVIGISELVKSNHFKGIIGNVKYECVTKNGLTKITFDNDVNRCVVLIKRSNKQILSVRLYEKHGSHFVNISMLNKIVDVTEFERLAKVIITRYDERKQLFSIDEILNKKLNGSIAETNSNGYKNVVIVLGDIIFTVIIDNDTVTVTDFDKIRLTITPIGLNGRPIIVEVIDAYNDERISYLTPFEHPLLEAFKWAIQ